MPMHKYVKNVLFIITSDEQQQHIMNLTAYYFINKGKHKGYNKRLCADYERNYITINLACFESGCEIIAIFKEPINRNENENKRRFKGPPERKLKAK